MFCGKNIHLKSHLNNMDFYRKAKIVYLAGEAFRWEIIAMHNIQKYMGIIVLKPNALLNEVGMEGLPGRHRRGWLHTKKPKQKK